MVEFTCGKENDSRNDLINSYKDSLSGDLLETFSDLIERAPEIINNLKSVNNWTVAGKIAPMLQNR